MSYHEAPMLHFLEMNSSVLSVFSQTVRRGKEGIFALMKEEVAWSD
jgi:hypothetical protein